MSKVVTTQDTPCDQGQNPMVPIPCDMLHEMLNKTVHVSWARRGAHWTLVKLYGNGKAGLRATSGGKWLYVDQKDLRYTREHQKNL